jgi:Lrp/AsnC family leucine-responsive transcriptional regulator
MKIDPERDLDPIDLRILDLLQENCKRPLHAIGERVGLTASSVMERIHKLEDVGIIRGYTALLDTRALGRDVVAFIGVAISHPRAAGAFERAIDREPDVLECHHVTGGYTLFLKVKTDGTGSLERLIDRLRAQEGVTGTETMVVLSTHTERVSIPLDAADAVPARRRRSAGGRARRAEAGRDGGNP